MPGKTRLFQHQRLKSSMVMILGVALPGSMSKALSRKQKSRSTSLIWGWRLLGCVIQKPIMPMAIWVISSACGWYIKVPGRRATNS